MKCQKCKSSRIIDISGKTSDCFVAEYKGKEYDGYVPEIGLGDDSDYITFRYCLDCGQIQGKFPIDEKVVQEQMFEDNEGKEE